MDNLHSNVESYSTTDIPTPGSCSSEPGQGVEGLNQGGDHLDPDGDLGAPLDIWRFLGESPGVGEDQVVEPVGIPDGVSGREVSPETVAQEDELIQLKTQKI